MSQEIGQKFLDELTGKQRDAAKAIFEQLVRDGKIEVDEEGVAVDAEQVQLEVETAALGAGYDEDTAYTMGEFAADTF